jgi:V-type H+-transporting ATPase subunit C
VSQQVQTGTLESLISLSEILPKHEAYFTSIIVKIVDTLRNLVNDESAKLQANLQVDGMSLHDYGLGRGKGGWKWNERRFGLQKSLKDLTDTLFKVPIRRLIQLQKY